MKRLALITLALVACGPSKAELAFASCQRHMDAKNWDAAESACKLAMDADPNNALYRQAYFDAGLARYSAGVASRKAESDRQRALIAAEEQAAAAQKDAETAILREARRSTE